MGRLAVECSDGSEDGGLRAGLSSEICKRLLAQSYDYITAPRFRNQEKDLKEMTAELLHPERGVGGRTPATSGEAPAARCICGGGKAPRPPRRR